MNTHDIRGSSTPEFRAAILCSMLSKVCATIEPIKALTVFQMVFDDLKVKEEVSSQEINTAMFHLVQSGLINSNGYQESAEEKSLILTADTTLVPGRQMLRYLWDEQTCDEIAT